MSAVLEIPDRVEGRNGAALLAIPDGLESQLVPEGITEELIATKREEYAALTADTAGGYKLVVAAIADLRTTRVAIEKRREDLKRDILEKGRKLDGTAKKWIGLLETIEDPLKAKKKAADDAKEFAKRAEKEAAEKVERDRLAAVAAEERRIAEEKRLEALKPDREKIAAWAASINDIQAPTVASDEAKEIVAAGLAFLRDTASQLMKFARD
jgi:hypothetical protein